MQIISDLKAELHPGDFSARVDSEQLALPRELVEVLAEANVRTAEDFLSLVQAFAGFLASRIGWTTAQIEDGRKLLLANLEGHVHPELLHPGLPQRRRFGVQPARRPL